MFSTNIESDTITTIFEYLSRSAFLVRFTDPNKQLPDVNISVKNLLIGNVVCKKYVDLLLFQR